MSMHKEMASATPGVHLRSAAMRGLSLWLEFQRRSAEEAGMKRSGSNRRLPYPGSITLFGLMAAMFLVELARGAVGNDGRLLILGALPDSGALHHEYWRLVTFGFLHYDLTHILLNTALLLLAGPAVERRAGARWVLVIFLAASVASGVGILVKHAFWPSQGASVGASGGMFGLLAAALVLVFRADAGSALARAALVAALLAGLAYSTLPGISMVGHLTGIAVGAAIALCISRRSLPVTVT
jgi:membrane associated rhomboid family serine protease